jgi:sulfide:quinone oxidoreductase
MKNLAILGAGTAGTAVANRLRKKLSGDWKLTLVDPDPVHLYQPDLIFIPFGMTNEAKAQRPRAKTILSGVNWVPEEVTAVDQERRRIHLGNGEALPYDLMVIASGAQIRPDETPGLLGEHWGRNIHEFYTLEGAQALRRALEEFDGGRLVLNVVEMPIKCPVAPLEFLFLADAHLTKLGIRERTELVYATPLDGAFTRPLAASMLGSLLERKSIAVEPEFNAGEVDADRRVLRSFDDRELSYDLLVTVPTHRGAPFIEASGMGNELDFVPTDRHTLLLKGDDHIFALGDATDLPTSKAGSVAHYQSEVVVENILRATSGRSLVEGFDGHATCFVETGFSRAVLIDFNYDVEPLPGRYPLPGVGPFSLLKETRRNHLGKRGFRWAYWRRLLRGKSLFVSHELSMKGKRVPERKVPVHTTGESHAHS